jgi:hypothetical protein
MSRNKDLSGADAQTATRVLELCSQFQQLCRAFEADGDPLALAEAIKKIDTAAVDEAHAWLTRQLVDRYAYERITLDTGRFRIPALKPVKA